LPQSLSESGGLAYRLALDRVRVALGTASLRLSLQSCLLLHESGFDTCVKVTHVNPFKDEVQIYLFKDPFRTAQ
jgi:hypothetical protein